MTAIVEALGGWGHALGFVFALVIVSAGWVALLFLRWVWRWVFSPYEYVKVQATSTSGGRGCLVGVAVVVVLALLLSGAGR